MVSTEDSQDPDATIGLTSSDPDHVRKWLAAHHRKQLTLLDKFLMELRLGRLGISKRGAGSADGEDDSNDDGDGGMTADGAASSGGSNMKRAVDRRLVVLQTVELLKYIMGPTSWKSAAELLHLVRAVGTELHTAGGMRREPAIGNVIRRILAAIREEAQRDVVANDDDDNLNARKTSESTTGGNRLSLDSILWALPQHVRDTGSAARSNQRGGGDNQRQESFLLKQNQEMDSEQPAFPPSFYQPRPDLKQTVMEAVQEILSDLEDTYKNLNEQSTSHIQAGDIVLTCGRSKTTELFLKSAANKIQQRNGGSFQVVVCEGGAGASGRIMATSLAAAGIETILIPDSAIFACMSRVNKVIIPAHAVLANGGLIASSGCNVVALAAHHNAVPVVCVSGIFKLTPVFPHEGQDTLNDLVSPSAVLEYANLKDPFLKDVEFINPSRDYIAPQYINLYVTNVGSFQPSFIYRLLGEQFHADDWDIFE